MLNSFQVIFRGAAVEHPETSIFPILVGPSTGDEFHRVSLPLSPVPCWAFEDVRFAFDSSFVGPDLTDTNQLDDIRLEFTHLAALIDSHPNPVVCIWHADPVGDDTYNKS